MVHGSEIAAKWRESDAKGGGGANAEYIYNAKLALVKVEVLPEAGNISVGINALHPTVEELVQARRRCG